MDTVMTTIQNFGLAIAAVLIILLGMRVAALDDRLTDLRRRSSMPHPGYFVPTFSTHNVSDTPVTIGAMEQPGRQIIFLLTTTCRYCLESLPAWSDLAAVADTFSAFPLQAHAVSLDELDATRRYHALNSLRFSTLTFPHERYARLFRANSVPQTLILDHNGLVEVARPGLLERGPALDSLLRRIGSSNSEAP